MKKTLSVFLFATLFVPALAKADTTYTYTGNLYTYNSIGCPSVCEITAVLDLSSALSPNMPLTYVSPNFFSITDGSVMESSTTTFSLYENSSFELSTDSLGNISTWDVSGTVCCLNGQYYGIETRNIPGGYGVIDQTQTYDLGEAFNLGNPGAWAVSTPEPSSVVLLLTGLIVLMPLILLGRGRVVMISRSHMLASSGR